MNPELQVQIVYADEHLLEVELFAANRRFAGSVNFYTALDELDGFAKRIEGFPNSPQDERRLKFSGPDTSAASEATVTLHFHCVDRAGRGCVSVAIQGEESAQFSILIDAAEIDDFVRELRRIQRNRSGKAVLAGRGITEP